MLKKRNFVLDITLDDPAGQVIPTLRGAFAHAGAATAAPPITSAGRRAKLMGVTTISTDRAMSDLRRFLRIRGYTCLIAVP
jgi:hypothetical protein